MMSPAQIEAIAHEAEIRRRIDEATSALLMLRVDTSGVFLADGYRRVVEWGLGTNNWSTPESQRMWKLARAFKALPTFAQACLEGRIGVAQMHAVAAVAANPRVKEHLAAADELFAGSAQELEFDELSILLRHWEELADANGARSKYDRAIQSRSANVRFVGEKAYLDAQGPVHDGVIFEQVLQRFVDEEWQVEWDMLTAIHGDQMCPALMERSPAQRRFDALQRLFAAAAGSTKPAGGTLVNIVIDQATFDHQHEELLGGHPEPIDPSHAPDRRCEDANGRPLDPRAVVAMAMTGQVRRLVIGADGVITDVGRKQRLFRGPLREAVLLAHRHCTQIGCRVRGGRCQADHLDPYGGDGLTQIANGAPACGSHNRWRNNGTRTVRDAKGRYHTIRPDGTEIGWPKMIYDGRYLHQLDPTDLAEPPP